MTSYVKMQNYSYLSKPFNMGDEFVHVLGS